MTGGHRRILVVEDDPKTAGEILEPLSISGYQVDLATSGSEALVRGLPKRPSLLEKKLTERFRLFTEYVGDYRSTGLELLSRI